MGFHFRVDFDGEQDIDFQEVTGINRELEVEKVKSGGENRFTYQLPTRASYPSLVLKRGLLKDSSLVANWVKDAIENLDIRPMTVVVTLLNENHEPLQAYNFVNVWPKKWSISDFNSSESKVVIETLELVYQYFTIQ